ncbi:MAG TPA: hypothetical protein PK668_25610 [Myxococcota bacterium]|nr:hypothetical protein [Myxococcota bacterium]HRY96905.1 hypothetical protein [Myxococcota bacterium]HSA22952.1 hypothetical protein [Myxococcota bacterium]
MGASREGVVLERLARLERSQCRLRVWVVGLALLLAAALLLGAAPAKKAPGPLQTRSLEIVDEAGKPRLRLAVRDGAPALSMLDEQGALRAQYGPRGIGYFKADGRLYYSSGHVDGLPAERPAE